MYYSVHRRTRNIFILYLLIFYLRLLKNISQRPILCGDSQATKNLITSLRELDDWLSKVVTRKIWTPSLDREVLLPLTRRQMVTFSGNFSKHHFAHLTDALKKIERLVADEDIPRHRLIPALDEIYSDLHDNVLNYHGSNIAELLNNVRWGIHDYLRPEFDRAYRKLEGIFYEFDVPKNIESDFAKSCYWDLMNSVRSKPYVNRFTANEIFKLRY
jgi:hypothetical protein